MRKGVFKPGYVHSLKVPPYWSCFQKSYNLAVENSVLVPKPSVTSGCLHTLYVLHILWAESSSQHQPKVLSRLVLGWGPGGWEMLDPTVKSTLQISIILQKWKPRHKIDKPIENIINFTCLFLLKQLLSYLLVSWYLWSTLMPSWQVIICISPSDICTCFSPVLLKNCLLSRNRNI